MDLPSERENLPCARQTLGSLRFCPKCRSVKRNLGGMRPRSFGYRLSTIELAYCFKKRLHPWRDAIFSGNSTESLKMADHENRYEDNAKGKFYVDDQCIDCDLCRETAPENFTRQEDGGYSYVFKQPENEVEEALCEEAMEGCPVEAIGDDGADG